MRILTVSLVIGLLPAHAQNADCDRIRAQIASLDQSGGGRPNEYSAAAQKQQAEIDRTSAYANSIGCSRGQFGFFGSQPPPQCASLNARINAMRTNLGQLQGMAARSGGGAPAQRQDLVARYNAYCRNQPRGFFDSLFGNTMPSQPEDIPPAPSDDDQAPRGGSQAVCVRTCDGGFFPLNYSARRGSLDSLQDLCTALCPNVQVSLFTRNPDNEIGTAVGADGTPYRELENAFKFEKSFDAACTCKAKGESWLQALSQSDAEHVLGQERKGDIIVTPEQSLEMSRPKIDAASRAKVLATDARPPAPDKTGGSAQDATPSPNKPPPAPANAHSTANPSGTQEIIGPDGVKRRVRIVGPTP